MPAKRGVATDDRNRVGVQLAGLALVELRLIYPLLFCPFEPSGSGTGLLDGKACKPENLRKELDKDKLTSVRFARVGLRRADFGNE
jgi:hypothetical protein